MGRSRGLSKAAPWCLRLISLTLHIMGLAFSGLANHRPRFETAFPRTHDILFIGFFCCAVFAAAKLDFHSKMDNQGCVQNQFLRVLTSLDRNCGF